MDKERAPSTGEGTFEVEVVGAPVSTFTRTVLMGLKLKNVVHVLRTAPPHSPLADEHHPMGLIPSLRVATRHRRRHDQDDAGISRCVIFILLLLLSYFMQLLNERCYNIVYCRMKFARVKNFFCCLHYYKGIQGQFYKRKKRKSTK